MKFTELHEAWYRQCIKRRVLTPQMMMSDGRTVDWCIDVVEADAVDVFIFVLGEHDMPLPIVNSGGVELEKAVLILRGNDPETLAEAMMGWMMSWCGFLK